MHTNLHIFSMHEPITVQLCKASLNILYSFAYSKNANNMKNHLLNKCIVWATGKTKKF